MQTLSPLRHCSGYHNKILSQPPRLPLLVHAATFLYPMRFGVGSCTLSVRCEIRDLARTTPFPHRQGRPTFREHLRAFKATRKTIMSTSPHPTSSEVLVCIAKDGCIVHREKCLDCVLPDHGFLGALQMATGDMYRTTYHEQSAGFLQHKAAVE